MEQQTVKTPYGPVHAGGPCKDDYSNIRLYHRDDGSTVKLQAPAMRAFKAAEDRYGKSSGRPSGTRLIPLSGSWRSCVYQTELHDSDPHRFADPDTSLHPRGIAIDVSTATSAADQARMHRALLAEGWTQARPDDEPWHYSYGFTA